MCSGAVGQIYCRHPLGLTPVRQGGAPVSASRTIVAIAVHTCCSTQNVCEFILVSRAQPHHANTLVGRFSRSPDSTHRCASQILVSALVAHWVPRQHWLCCPAPWVHHPSSSLVCCCADSSSIHSKRWRCSSTHSPLCATLVSFSRCTLRGGQSLVVRTGLPPFSMSAQAHLGAAHHLHPCLVPVGPLVHKTRHLHECCSSRKGRIVHLFRMISLSASPRRCRSLRSQRRRHSNTLSVTRSVKPATSNMTSACKLRRFTSRPTAFRPAHHSLRFSSPGASCPQPSLSPELLTPNYLGRLTLPMRRPICTGRTCYRLPYIGLLHAGRLASVFTFASSLSLTSGRARATPESGPTVLQLVRVRSGCA